MTTELVTNAVEHARTSFTVTVDLTSEKLRVVIRDGCDAQPVADLVPSETDMTGRGLVLVGALADRWGVSPNAPGKSVWFETRGASL